MPKPKSLSNVDGPLSTSDDPSTKSPATTLLSAMPEQQMRMISSPSMQICPNRSQKPKPATNSQRGLALRRGRSRPIQDRTSGTMRLK